MIDEEQRQELGIGFPIKAETGFLNLWVRD